MWAFFLREAFATVYALYSKALRIDRLPEDKVYYWRSRATVSGATGPYNATRAFTVGPEVVLQAPVQQLPANGGNATGNAPMLTVSNASKRGPAGEVIYRFEFLREICPCEFCRAVGDAQPETRRRV